MNFPSSVTEKGNLLDVETDLKDCKVITISVIYFLDYSSFNENFLEFSNVCVQRNLDNSNKELLDLEENCVQVISKLKGKRSHHENFSSHVTLVGFVMRLCFFSYDYKTCHYMSA